MGAGSICRELGIDRGEFESRVVDTVYFGGGTPSLLSADRIAAMIQLLKEVFVLAGNVEMTLEVNPGTVSPEKAQAHIRHGCEPGQHRNADFPGSSASKNWKEP